jgi:hypothetical protein
MPRIVRDRGARDFARSGHLRAVAGIGNVAQH